MRKSGYYCLICKEIAQKFYVTSSYLLEGLFVFSSRSIFKVSQENHCILTTPDLRGGLNTVIWMKDVNK